MKKKHSNTSIHKRLHYDKKEGSNPKSKRHQTNLKDLVYENKIKLDIEVYSIYMGLQNNRYIKLVSIFLQLVDFIEEMKVKEKEKKNTSGFELISNQSQIN